MAPSSLIEEQNIYWMRYLEEKQKNIERTKKYVGDQDVEWWGNFFNHQHTILKLTIWSVTGHSKFNSNGILVPCFRSVIRTLCEKCMESR